MNPKDRKVSRLSPPNDELLRLEMKIAQRADRLSLARRSLRRDDLADWLQAEHEILVELALAS